MRKIRIILAVILALGVGSAFGQITTNPVTAFTEVNSFDTEQAYADADMEMVLDYDNQTVIIGDIVVELFGDVSKKRDSDEYGKYIIYTREGVLNSSNVVVQTYKYKSKNIPTYMNIIYNDNHGYSYEINDKNLIIE